MASLGMIYTEEDISTIYPQLLEEYGNCGYEAFLGFLREITEDTTSPDQLLEAFQGLAGEKPYLTEMDLKLAMLPPSSVEHFKAEMPEIEGEEKKELLLNGEGSPAGDKLYDYEAYLRSVRCDWI